MRILEHVKNEDDYMRRMIGDAIWSVLYHERELALAHRSLAVVKAALSRGFSAAELADIDNEPEPEDATTALEYARALLCNALDHVTHHEDQLRAAHKDLAFSKAVLARAKYAFDIKEIEAEQTERLDAKGARRNAA
jgi:hypothetical protein